MKNIDPCKFHTLLLHLLPNGIQGVQFIKKYKGSGSKPIAEIGRRLKKKIERSRATNKPLKYLSRIRGRLNIRLTIKLEGGSRNVYRRRGCNSKRPSGVAKYNSKMFQFEEQMVQARRYSNRRVSNPW